MASPARTRPFPIAARDADGSLAAEHVIRLADGVMREFGSRRAGRDEHVIDVGPRRREHRRARRRAARGRRSGPLRARRSPSACARRSQQRRVESNRHERGDRIERRADARVAEIEVVVDAGDERHVQIHPLHRRRPGIVDRVRVAGPAEDAGRALHARRAPVDRELRFAVEDHEHLLDDVVEVMADAGARRNDAAMQEVELRRDRAAIQQRRERHVPAPPWTADRRRYAAGSVCAIRCASAPAAAGLCARTGQGHGHGDDQQEHVSHCLASVHARLDDGTRGPWSGSTRPTTPRRGDPTRTGAAPASKSIGPRPLKC